MANPEHLAKLEEGYAAWNDWRAANPEEEIDLCGANLNGASLALAQLRGADLGRADLRGANLTGAELSCADLSEADLGGANVEGADLSDANLTSANISRANLASAHLIGSNFRGSTLAHADLTFANCTRAHFRSADLTNARLDRTNLYRANLTKAKLLRTVLSSVDLSSARGLGLCRHIGPSIIDHSTIAQSWPLPLAFLRGCGLPENYITYLPSLLNQPIQLYSCFISYSTQDQPFADRLHADLQNAGVRCWFALHDMSPGQKIHEQIDEAIRLHDKLLLILSPHSMNSEWVKTEIAKARKRELAEKRRMLFPVTLAPFESIKTWECFDADTGKDSAKEIREYFIPDFSTWKTNHDAYKSAFDRLVRSLQPKENTTSAKA